MNNEQKAYLKLLTETLHRGRRVASTSMCHSGPYVSLVWRITPELGCTFEIIGRDPTNREQVLLHQSFPSLWEIFGNLPLDPLSFVEDPNQDLGNG
jgi:hypothetical protein